MNELVVSALAPDNFSTEVSDWSLIRPDGDGDRWVSFGWRSVWPVNGKLGVK